MNPDVWTGPAAAGAILLVTAGMAKAARPDDTWRALRAAGLGGGPAAVRVGAVGEAAVGSWAVVTADPLAMALVASSYAAFVVFLVVAMARSLPVSSCGCFGEPDVPPTRTHVAIDLAAGVAAAGAAVTAAPSLATVTGTQPLAGIPYLGLVALAVASAALALTRLARLRAVAGVIASERP